MEHRHSDYSDYGRHADREKRSLPFQLLGSSRVFAPPVMLLELFKSNWFTDPHECDDEDRNALLTFLCTFNRVGAIWDHHRIPPRAVLTREEHEKNMPKGAVQVAKKLLELGVDPFKKDKEGRDALDAAFALQWFELLEDILKMYGAPDLKSLMARQIGAKPKYRDLEYQKNEAYYADMPWIHAAVACNNLGMVEWLLNLGFDPNQKDEQGDPPLCCAHVPEMVDLLIGRGAHPDIQGLGERWSFAKIDKEQLTAMNAVLAKGLNDLAKKDPTKKSALAALQIPTLFDLASRKSKEVFEKFLRVSKCSGNEQIPGYAGLPSPSVIGYAALENILSGVDNFAILNLLAEKNKDWSHESIPGVSDLMLVFCAQTSTPHHRQEKYLKTLEGHLKEKYGSGDSQGETRKLEDWMAVFSKIWEYNNELKNKGGGRFDSRQLGNKIGRAMSAGFKVLGFPSRPFMDMKEYRNKNGKPLIVLALHEMARFALETYADDPSEINEYGFSSNHSKKFLTDWMFGGLKSNLQDLQKAELLCPELYPVILMAEEKNYGKNKRTAIQALIGFMLENGIPLPEVDRDFRCRLEYYRRVNPEGAEVLDREIESKILHEQVVSPLLNKKRSRM